MLGIDPSVMVHRLNANPNHKPVIQKRRSYAPEKSQAIEVEVKTLRDAGFIREVSYPEWIANVVLVKKSNAR